MNTYRPTAVAGLFYPDSAKELKNKVEGLLAACSSNSYSSTKAIKAIITPHAGYDYSGAIAASVYANLNKCQPNIDVVFLIGPAHRVAYDGIAIPTMEEFSSPLGRIRLNKKILRHLLNFSFVHESNLAHKEEHSLEVQLPFLQISLNQFELVPLLIGDCSPDKVNELIESIWDTANSLIVISSDLSHFHDYKTAQKMDQETSNAIEHLDHTRIDYDHACGKTGIQAILISAKKHELNARTIDLRNSGDTFGSKDRVVGYGAYVIQ